MASKKLEKIAREYRIDPSTLPPVDGQSVTFNVKKIHAAPVQPVEQTRETRQSEHDRLRAEAHAANAKLREHQRAARERNITARRG